LEREDAANERDHIDVVARPAGDLQHFVDSQPGHAGAPAFFAAKPLLLDGPDKAVVLECGGGSVMEARLERQNTQLNPHPKPD
jgi:hypothetical protein